MFATEIRTAILGTGTSPRPVAFYTRQGDLYSNIDGDMRVLLDEEDFGKPLPALRSRVAFSVFREVYGGASRNVLDVLDAIGGGRGGFGLGGFGF